MKTKLFNNLLLKILSVAAAILLWLVVVNINDAVDSKIFKNIKVQVVGMEVLTSQGQMCQIEPGTDTVNLTVYARRTVLNKLKASDFVATADIQKDLIQNKMVKIDVAYVGNEKTDSIERIEQSRSNVSISIEESVTEQFKVAVEQKSEPSNGLVVGSLVPEQTVVEITGPKSVIERIKKVKASVNVVGITGTTVRSTTLELLDGNGDAVDGTYLEYTGKGEGAFKVTITTLNKKEVGISFDISTAAPEGYGVSAFKYVPETIEIAGLQSEIKSIYNLDIPPEALNPEGQTGQIEQIVDISQYLPDGIIIPSEADREIVVTMDILPFETSNYTFLSGQIQYQNIQDGLVLDVSETEPLQVEVSGLPADLAEVSMEDITVSVDLSECSRRGTYKVPVTVSVPEKVRVPEGLEMTVKLERVEEE